LFALLYLFVLFSQSSVDHRALHSFPTRRSSDLVVGKAHDRAAAGLLEEREGRAAERHERIGADFDGGLEAVAANLVEAPLEVVRSEEHTSELQSRVDLVCRLLLEKKKEAINEIY